MFLLICWNIHQLRIFAVIEKLDKLRPKFMIIFHLLGLQLLNCVTAQHCWRSRQLESPALFCAPRVNCIFSVWTHWWVGWPATSCLYHQFLFPYLPIYSRPFVARVEHTRAKCLTPRQILTPPWARASAIRLISFNICMKSKRTSVIRHKVLVSSCEG